MPATGVQLIATTIPDAEAVTVVAAGGAHGVGDPPPPPTVTVAVFDAGPIALPAVAKITTL